MHGRLSLEFGNDTLQNCQLLVELAIHARVNGLDEAQVPARLRQQARRLTRDGPCLSQILLTGFDPVKLQTDKGELRQASDDRVHLPQSPPKFNAVAVDFNGFLVGPH